MTKQMQVAAALCELNAKALTGEWLDGAGMGYMFVSYNGHSADVMLWANGQMRLPGITDDYFLWGGDPSQPAEPDRIYEALHEQMHDIVDLICEGESPEDALTREWEDEY